jgi:hypothetical protein
VVIDDEAANVGGGFHQILEAVVPVGRGLEQEHDALVGEAELQVAGFADVLQKRFGVVDVDIFLFGEVVFAELLDEDGDVGLFEDDLAHGDEGRAGGLGVLDEVLPAVGAVVLEEDRGYLFGDVAGHAAHAMAGDEGYHVVFEGEKIIGLHRF